MKTCTKCNIEKSLSEFSIRKLSKDGLQPSCRACNKLYNQANKEKIKTSRAKSYAENKEQRLLAAALYRLLNKAKVRDSVKKWRSKNPEKLKQSTANWQRNNPESRRANEGKRRAARAGAGGKHTANDIKHIFESQKGLCAGCRAELFKSGAKKYHVDHIMPLSLGGSNWPENLQCLCPPCNLSKGARHPDDWARENGRLL